MESAFVSPVRRPNRTIASRSKNRARARGGMGSKKKKTSKDPVGELVLFKAPHGSSLASRVLRGVSTISTTAGGVLAVTPQGVQTLITALGTEWNNFAQEFQEFRIKKIGYRFIPSTTAATSSTGPYQGSVISSPYWQLAPSTSSSILQSDQCVIFSTLEEKQVYVPNAGPNFHLWNAVGVSYPADREFGLAFYIPNAIAASSRIFDEIYELFVEFRVAY